MGGLGTDSQQDNLKLILHQPILFPHRGQHRTTKPRSSNRPNNPTLRNSLQSQCFSQRSGPSCFLGHLSRAHRHVCIQPALSRIIYILNITGPMMLRKSEVANTTANLWSRSCNLHVLIPAKLQFMRIWVKLLHWVCHQLGSHHLFHHHTYVKWKHPVYYKSPHYIF